jgi:YD repeat-containing protein
MNTHTHTHTPGPWTIEIKGSRHFIDGADELTVAYVDRAGVRERQTYEANARLIASAPELLAALKEMAEQFGHYCEHTEDAKEIETLIKARAAIAKAEGVK